jgi:hypothetical protein
MPRRFIQSPRRRGGVAPFNHDPGPHWKNIDRRPVSADLIRESVEVFVNPLPEIFLCFDRASVPQATGNFFCPCLAVLLGIYDADLNQYCSFWS